MSDSAPGSARPPLQRRRLDLNADVGESYGAWVLGDDAALLDVVTSANVACGAYAGDPSTMRRTCALAVARGVRIGAQVGYRDLAGFGRRFVDVAPAELVDEVLVQTGALQAVARVEGGTVAFVKPHGALYGALVHHEAQARAVLEAVRLLDLPLVALPGSAVARAAERAGHPVLREGFADRAYTPQGTLVPRAQPGSLLTGAREVVAQARALAAGEVTAVDGSRLPTRIDTLCLHGDTPGAARLAAAVRTALEADGVRLAAGG